MDLSEEPAPHLISRWVSGHVAHDDVLNWMASCNIRRLVEELPTYEDPVQQQFGLLLIMSIRVAAGFVDSTLFASGAYEVLQEHMANHRLYIPALMTIFDAFMAIITRIRHARDRLSVRAILAAGDVANDDCLVRAVNLAHQLRRSKYHRCDGAFVILARALRLRSAAAMLNNAYDLLYHVVCYSLDDTFTVDDLAPYAAFDSLDYCKFMVDIMCVMMDVNYKMAAEAINIPYHFNPDTPAQRNHYHMFTVVRKLVKWRAGMTKEEHALQDAARAWLADNLPPYMLKCSTHIGILFAIYVESVTRSQKTFCATPAMLTWMSSALPMRHVCGAESDSMMKYLNVDRKLNNEFIVALVQFRVHEVWHKALPMKERADFGNAIMKDFESLVARSDITLKMTLDDFNWLATPAGAQCVQDNWNTPEVQAKAPAIIDHLVSVLADVAANDPVRGMDLNTYIQTGDKTVTFMFPHGTFNGDNPTIHWSSRLSELEVAYHFSNPFLRSGLQDDGAVATWRAHAGTPDLHVFELLSHRPQSRRMELVFYLSDDATRVDPSTFVHELFPVYRDVVQVTRCYVPENDPGRVHVYIKTDVNFRDIYENTDVFSMFPAYHVPAVKLYVSTGDTRLSSQFSKVIRIYGVRPEIAFDRSSCVHRFLKQFPWLIRDELHWFFMCIRTMPRPAGVRKFAKAYKYRARDTVGHTAVHLKISRDNFIESLDEVLSLYTNSHVSLSISYLGEPGNGPGVTRDIICDCWKHFHTQKPPVWRDHNPDKPELGRPRFPHHKLDAKTAYLMGVLTLHTMMNTVTPSVLINPVLWELVCMDAPPSVEWRNDAFAKIDPDLAKAFKAIVDVADVMPANSYEGESPFVDGGDTLETTAQFDAYVEKVMDVTCGATFWTNVIVPFRKGLSLGMDVRDIRSGINYAPGLKRIFHVANAKMLLDCWDSITYADNLSPGSDVVRWLREFVEEPATYDRAEALLKFWTGETTLPLGRTDTLDPPLLISQLTYTTEMKAPPWTYAPTAATCTRHLKIPAYRSKEELTEKFDLALTEAGNTFPIV